MVTFAPSGSGRARSHTVPFTRTARAALARPGPIALARSAPVAPSGRRFSLPSGSVTRISAATMGSGGRLDDGGADRTGERRQPASVAEVERDGEGDNPRDRDPAGEAGWGGVAGFVGHREGIFEEWGGEGWVAGV